jgi:hypothetical protein
MGGVGGGDGVDVGLDGDGDGAVAASGADEFPDAPAGRGLDPVAEGGERGPWAAWPSGLLSRGSGALSALPGQAHRRWSQPADGSAARADQAGQHPGILHVV